MNSESTVHCPHVYPAGCVFSSLADIKNKHITVMGLGLNGGGEAAVRFFLKYGAYVVATDMKTERELKPTVDSLNNDAALNRSRLTYRLGEHYLDDFRFADCVIKNPGVKYEGNVYLACAKAIETDMSIFLAFTKAPIIAVTGSKGKSSTASAIYFGLSQAGLMTFLGGNITVSPLSFLEKTNETTPVVLELSSWQLADLRGRKLLKPRISLITKIVPDHQNWYGDMASYIADKRLIYADQEKNNCSIFDADPDDEGTPEPEAGLSWGDFFARESKATVFRYSVRALPAGVYGAWQDTDTDGKFLGRARLPGNDMPVTLLRSVSVPGRHMRANVLNAALVMALSGIGAQNISNILSRWKGIPHRLQYFHVWKQKNMRFHFYNDSCATVPEAAAAAVKSFKAPVILIAGGTDKGLGQNALSEALSHDAQKRVKALYLLSGTATDKLTELLCASRIPFYGPYDSLGELLGALKANECADDEREANEVVLFSPGATSFGMFTNEFERGSKFMEEVKRIFP